MCTTPNLPPQPFRSRFSGGGSPGGLLNFKLHVPETLSPEQLQSEIDAYDGAFAYVDDSLAQLLSGLKQTAPTRDLIIIVTSDHGEEFGEHGGFLHARHVYREAIHVPLVVWAPGRVPAGARVSQPVSNAAIPATLMAMWGHPDPPFPGPPLAMWWDGTAVAGTWPLPVAAMTQRSWAPTRDPVHDGSLRSLTSPAWHYIEQQNREPLLFDWAADPRETADLAGRADLRGVRQDLAARLAALGRN